MGGPVCITGLYNLRLKEETQVFAFVALIRTNAIQAFRRMQGRKRERERERERERGGQCLKRPPTHQETGREDTSVSQCATVE